MVCCIGVVLNTYEKVPRLVVKKTSRLTQAVVFFRRHFLCGALLCVVVHRQSEKSIYTFTTGMFSRTLYAQYPVTKNLHIYPRFSPSIFISRCKFSTLTSTPLYSSINGLYAQNPVFEIVHDESVKVYPHMYNGNVQQNPLCVELCVTKEFAIFPRFSPTSFDPDASSVLLREYLCTAVDSMRRKPCVRNCPREREGLYNGNIQQNPLCAASCVTKDTPISPRSPPTFFHRRANPAPYSAQFLIHSIQLQFMHPAD